MKVWGKHRPGLAGRGVARAAVAGFGRQELVDEAIQVVLANRNVDRAGVWIDSGENSAENTLGFHGRVCNAHGEQAPAEWARLSPEAPVPHELLSRGETVEQELEDSQQRLVIGALVEMRGALWVPIKNGHALRGILFAGTRTKQAVLPRLLLEAVAAELALAMELEKERQLARERHADIRAARRLLAASDATDAILADLVGSCTEKGHGGTGAVFAVIAQLRRPAGIHRAGTEGQGVAADPRSPAVADSVTRGRDLAASELLQFSWWSGDVQWTRAVESEPLAGIWQRAVDARRTIWSETVGSWAQGEIARVVAIPLEAGGETLGVLVAGLSPGFASLAALERLEFRAALAASVVVRRKRNVEAKRQAVWQQALLQASREALVLLDADGEIVGWSGSARQLLGQAEREDFGEETGPCGSERFEELFCTREKQRMQQWLRQLPVGATWAKVAGEIPPETELYNGVRVRVHRIPRPGEGIVAVVLEPLREERAATRPHPVADAQLFSLIEWLEEGVVLFDANNGIHAMNTRFAQIVGWSAEQAGRIATLSGLISQLAGQSADPEGFAEHWRELAFGSEGGAREEFQLLRPVPRVLERAARPVLDAAGRRLGHVEIYRDLTAQRVFQSKLLQTEKLAALGQMVTSVAHELNNPLTSVLGYAQRLLLRGEASGQAEEARHIFQEAERASTILRQLLVTAREAPPGRAMVALNEVVSRTMELQRFSLTAEKIHVELELDPHLPFVHGNAGQLQQVLMNLMGNARQAVEPQGRGGTIQVSTRRAGERHVVLEVRDSGPGIPDSILARIFDPFFTTKPAGTGTGLGLSIVLGIVREHGGQVKVASPPTGGAIFTLEFPVAVAEEAHSPALPTTGPGALGFPRERQNIASVPSPEPSSSAAVARRVLVVEDEPTVARLIGDVLEDEGFRVDLLLDGREALKRAASENYDLVICDMKMPELDGQNFYTTLALTGNPLQERFLFVTGDVIAAHTQEFLALHRLPHVAKPFRVEELTEKVRQVLAGAGPRQPAVAGPGARSNAARK
jgi:signal transduction histidine kinase/CheY-like chemotaxis protein